MLSLEASGLTFFVVTLCMVMPHRLFVGFRLLAFIVTFIVGLSPLTATLLLFERPKISKQEKSRPGRFFTLIRPMTS